jgi:hypothetical protein
MVVGMPSRYWKLKVMADECRKLAALFEHDTASSRLLAIAAELEQWANETARNEATRPEESGQGHRALCAMKSEGSRSRRPDTCRKLTRKARR